MADFGKETLNESRRRLEKALEVLAEELRGIRTGRATPSLIEGIKVDYYGTPTPLNQLAQISAPDPRGLLVKPYDAGALGEMERAILKSDLGITPSNDGKLIRLQFPPLSEEQRKKLATRVKDIAENTKVSLRNVRRDQNKAVDGAEKAKEPVLTEDQARDLRERIQELLKEFEGKVDQLVQRKRQEILEG